MTELKTMFHSNIYLKFVEWIKVPLFRIHQNNSIEHKQNRNIMHNVQVYVHKHLKA